MLISELEFPSVLAEEGYLLSNVAPVYWSFMNDGRRILIEKIKKLATKKSSVNVILGPVFDYDFNGIKDDLSQIR